MLEKILIGIVIAIAAVILIVIIVSIVKSAKNNKKVKITTENNKEVIQENSITEEVKEEKKVMKIVIGQNESIVVGSEGRIPCGEYTIEGAAGEESVNVRIGRYVREYKSGTTVVLADKQKVTPVSASIILR